MERERFFPVVVATHARPRQVTTCLAALAGLDYPRARFEVVVVDDGGPTPSDATVAPYRDRLQLTFLS